MKKQLLVQENMKIITWNCIMAFRKKADLILINNLTF